MNIPFKKHKFVLVLFLSAILPLSSTGAEMVHGYVNPDFGGSPLNGAYLLSNAGAQNTFTAPQSKVSPASVASSGNTSTTLTTGQAFAQKLDTLYLNTLANNLVNNALGSASGTTTPTSGTGTGTNTASSVGTIKTFDTGINTVTVDTTNPSATNVTIMTDATGQKTVVTIPVQ